MPVTPDDDNDLPNAVRALRVVEAGDVEGVTIAGNSRTIAVTTDVTAVNRWAQGSRKVSGPAVAYIRLLLSIHRARNDR